MYSLLIGLDIKAKVNLVCGYNLAYIGQVCRLNTIQKDKEGKDFVISLFFRFAKAHIILNILRHINFFGYPKVVHRLSVPVANPVIFKVVKVVKVGGIAIDKASFIYLNITPSPKMINGGAQDLQNGRMLKKHCPYFINTINHEYH